MKYVPDLTARLLVKSTCFRTGNVRCGLRTAATNQKQKRHRGVLIFGWGALNSLARRGAPAVGKP